MEKCDVTQADLSRLMSMSRSGINWWVRGHTYPSIDNVERLADILKTTPEWLLFGARKIQAERLSESIPVIDRINGRQVEITRIALPREFMARANMPSSENLRAVTIFNASSGTSNIAIADTSDREVTANKPKMMVIDYDGKVDVAAVTRKRGVNDRLVIEVDGNSTELPYQESTIVGRLAVSIEAKSS
jgi:transcriptional regulator with XRE-family HTH domain